MKLTKLANWMSDGDLEKYEQKAKQASEAQAQLQKTESKLKELKANFQQAEKELAQSKAQLQINQGFQIELGETQLRLQKAEVEAQRYKKDLFEREKQFNLVKSQLTQAKKALERSQNWMQQIQIPIQVIEIKKTLPKENFDTLWGFGILSPNVELVTNTGALIVKGWVLGKQSEAKTLQVSYQDRQILSTTADIRLPKIASQYPDIPTAHQCGFEFSLSVAGIPGLVELNLEAVLQDETIVPLCAIALQPKVIESKDT